MALIEKTGYEAGFDGREQVLIAIEAIYDHGGEATMSQLYKAFEKILLKYGYTLSAQGKHSFRRYVNHDAVKGNLIYPHDESRPGWRLTPEGKAEVERVRSGRLFHAERVANDTQDEVVADYKRRIGKVTETEAIAETKRRIGQQALRRALLDEYNRSCAMCDVSDESLLRASHIVPWNEDENNRLNPRNAVLLCGLHDLAFEKGVIVIEKDFRLSISESEPGTTKVLREITRKNLRLPRTKDLAPDEHLLARVSTKSKR